MDRDAPIVASSLLAMAYVWRFVEIAYFREPPGRGPRLGRGAAGVLVPAWVLVAAVLCFGVDTSVTVGFAVSAAEMLAGDGDERGGAILAALASRCLRSIGDRAARSARRICARR